MRSSCVKNETNFKWRFSKERVLYNILSFHSAYFFIFIFYRWRVNFLNLYDNI